MVAQHLGVTLPVVSRRDLTADFHGGNVFSVDLAQQGQETLSAHVMLGRCRMRADRVIGRSEEKVRSLARYTVHAFDCQLIPLTLTSPEIGERSALPRCDPWQGLCASLAAQTLGGCHDFRECLGTDHSGRLHLDRAQ